MKDVRQTQRTLQRDLATSVVSAMHRWWISSRFAGAFMRSRPRSRDMEGRSEQRTSKRLSATIHRLRTATDLLRRAAVDSVAVDAIIGHTTDCVREHDSTVGLDEAQRRRVRVSLLPAPRR